VGIRLTGNVTISLVVTVPALRRPSGPLEYNTPIVMAERRSVNPQVFHASSQPCDDVAKAFGNSKTRGQRAHQPRDDKSQSDKPPQMRSHEERQAETVGEGAEGTACEVCKHKSHDRNCDKSEEHQRGPSRLVDAPHHSSNARCGEPSRERTDRQIPSPATLGVHGITSRALLTPT
jgi:hypothetical protein